MMKRRLSFLILLFFLIFYPGLRSFASNFFYVWESQIDSVTVLSSPRCYDMNGDSVKDIIIGGGKQNSEPNYEFCLNGINGHVIWKTRVKTDVYTSAVLYDINNDSTPEVFVGGYYGGLYCLDGKTGNLIWQYYTDTINPISINLYNFYDPQIIPDQDHDGYSDLLITNGGNPYLPANSTDRRTGYLMIISSKNGTTIAKDSLPDRKETYFSPILVDLDNDGNMDIIYGTGGETDTGSLWTCRLSDLKNQTVYTNSTRLDGPYPKGFIQPCLISDFNRDNHFDILSMNFDGHLKVIDGVTKDTIWSLHLPGYEFYTSPTIVNFNNDSIPDIEMVISRGIYQYTYNGFQTLIIDGQNGNYNIIDTSGYLVQIGSGISYKNGDYSNVILNYNQSSDSITHFKLYFVDYNIHTNTFTPLTDTFIGINFASTPMLCDLDSDHKCELIFAYNHLPLNKAFVRCYYTQVPPENVLWGEYYGNDKNNIYNNITTVSRVPTFQKQQLELYPSLSKDRITFQSDQLFDRYIIADLSGKILFAESVPTTKVYEKNISGLPRGNYILCIQYHSDITGTAKFIKQ